MSAAPGREYLNYALSHIRAYLLYSESILHQVLNAVSSTNEDKTNFKTGHARPQLKALGCLGF